MSERPQFELVTLNTPVNGTSLESVVVSDIDDDEHAPQEEVPINVEESVRQFSTLR